MNEADDGDLRSSLVTDESTILDRWIKRSSWPRWAVIVAIGALLVLIPLTLAVVDGISPTDFYGSFRAQVIYALILIYLLTILPRLERTRAGVALSLRPVINVEDETYVRLVNDSCRVRRSSEIIAFGLGMLVGMVINMVFEPIEDGPYFLTRYAYLSRIGIFGTIVWATFVIVAITRMTNVLLRQPSKVDIFDLQPFVPVGRQSVWLSLAFLGAVTLSLFSASFTEQSLWLQYAINYAVFMLVIVALFLLNTHGVHRLLARVKGKRLAFLDGCLARSYADFERLLLTGDDRNAVATDINALVTLRQEVKNARTWPYNTEMLRTVAISVVTPIVVALTRLLPILIRTD